ncbi:hypothetical protein ABIB15_001847 [Marisediminicola sp. UYEF4]
MPQPRDDEQAIEWADAAKWPVLAASARQTPEF